MNFRNLLSAVVASAGALTACVDAETSQLGLGTGGVTQNPAETVSGKQAPGSQTAPTSPGSTDTSTGAPPVPGNLPTNSKAGKAFFTANVSPILEAKCSGCHVEGGAGQPTWMAKGDASKTYDMIYLNGYAIPASRIVTKGVHSGGGAPALTEDEKSKWATWVQTEAADGGQKAQVNVLESLGTCFDKAKFDAIKLESLQTEVRTANNNPKKVTENANQVTGAPTKCATCHASDSITGFVCAVGNPLLPADYTFEESKKLFPSYIRQYFATSPDGTLVASNGIEKKSTYTIEMGTAYSHPLFKMPDTVKAGIKAFVDDTIAKHAAGTCGK